MPIQSVKVTINGTQHSLTYNATTGLYETTISAPGTTSYNINAGHYYPVSVTVADTAGNSTAVNDSDSTFGQYLKLRVKETVAPVVTITSPTASQFIKNNKPTITWTVTDSGAGVNPDTIGITIDSGSKITGSSISKSAITNGYSCSYTPSTALSAGSHTVKVDATDYDDNVATQKSVTFTVDTTNPSLSVTAPANNSFTKTSSCTVTGTISDTNLNNVTVKLNSGTAEAVTVSGTSFSKSLTLATGANTITVVATDKAGNSSTVTRTVTLDTTVPTLSVTAPTNNLKTTTASLTVTGTASDTYLDKVTVKLNSGSASDASLSGTSFSKTITLAEGSNTITVVAYDKAGNTASVTRTVILDTTGPNLVVTSPANNSLTNSASCSVAGTVNDASTSVSSVTVKLNSGSAQAATVSSGSFSKNITLAEGSNTITIVATDELGNTTTVVRTVTLDTQPPVLTVTAPANNSYTNKSSCTVTGTVSGQSTLTVTLNNGSAQTVTVSSGSFSKNLTLASGSNTITVIATDAAGNATTVTRTVTLDTVAPTIVTISITPNPVNTGNTYKIAIKATDA